MPSTAWTSASLDSLASNVSTGPHDPSGKRLAERRALGTVATTQHLVERHHADRGDLAQRLVEVADGHLELGRDLGVVRACAAAWPRGA